MLGLLGEGRNPPLAAQSMGPSAIALLRNGLRPATYPPYRGSVAPTFATPRACITSVISSKMAGSSIVAGILHGSPSAIWRMVPRRILPRAGL